MIWAHPLTAMIIPLLGAIGIVAFGKKPNLREGATIVSALTLFACVITIVIDVLQGRGAATATPLVEVVPGISLAFQATPLGLVYATVAATLWPLNSLYSIGYMRGNNEKHQTRFYLCFAIAISSALGIAFSANLFTLFVFYEVLTLSTYPLVAHKGAKVLRSARTYMGILVTSSIGCFLPAVIWTWVVTNGNLTFETGGIFPQVVSDVTVGIIYALMIYGIGKCALMPLHRWLPAAMVAPTPVSALLHAVAVVKAGVFSVTKVTIDIFGIERLAAIGWADWLLYMAGFTILCASFIALHQDNLKRRLAYSTVSQLSYIVLGAAMFSPLGVMAAGMHIAAHAFGKITLFFAAGSIYTAAHKTEISQLDGIGRRMPWTMGAFTVGSMSMIGLPLTAGLVSKWYLLGGAWSIQSWFVLGVLTLSTLLNAGYFLPIVHRAFFRPEVKDDAHGDDDHGHGEAPWPIVVALSTTALFTVIFFFWPGPFGPLMELVFQSVGGAP